jgi:L-fuconolactonase
VVAGLRRKPGCAGIRVHAGFDGNTWRDPEFEEGGYSRLFEACQAEHVPVFIMVTPRAETLEPYLKNFPDLKFVIDHIGISWPAADTAPTERYARLDKVRSMAKYGNLHLKWSHVERLAAQAYPYTDLIPHFRKVVDEYGAERILWASDHTQAVKPGLSPHPAPYSHSLHYLLDSDAFSEAEKEWMLGRSVRTVLDWNI